jgi:CRISPR-associated protein Cas1
MIKRTLYFGNPAYLYSKNEQLIISKKNDATGENEEVNVPIEDIGVFIVDHYGVTVSQYLISLLLENNVAVIFCNKNHMPAGLFLNLDGNALQSEKFRKQIQASKPLLKKLWKQTVIAKICNQAALLNKYNKPCANLLKLATEVKTNDSSNLEARAAVYYWQTLYQDKLNFSRDRFGEPPNNLLNYGYAVLRAVVARGLVASGLLPTLGIHHHNKYNAYCLADDIMEPFRPFVDEIVLNIINDNIDFFDLTVNLKKRLLQIPVIDIYFGKEKSPLMVGLQRTTSSLAKCFSNESKNIVFPELK